MSAITVGAAMLASAVFLPRAALAQRGATTVVVPEGTYRIEPEGAGGEEEPFVMIIVHDEPTAPAEVEDPGTPETEFAPSSEALEAALVPDCEEARGRYLERLLELHGTSLPAGVRPRDLAALTHGPLPAAAMPYPGWPPGLWADPALAPLYGAPPIPPGALAYDFTLRNLAVDLVRCAERHPAEEVP
jgi:hypothetical protein